MVPFKNAAFPRRTLVGVMLFVTISAFGHAALSHEQADAIIAAEMTARAEREAKRKGELTSVPASGEWTIQQGEHRILLRRVSTPETKAFSKNEILMSETMESEQPFAPENVTPHFNFTLFVTIFGEEFTKFRTARPNGITVLINRPYTYLPGVMTIETEEATFSFFSFVSRIDSETETNRLWPDPAIFSTTSPEYVVYTEAESDVPSDLLEAIDVLHRHYLENKADFEAKAQRATALEAARARVQNPPKETIINFFPVKSRIHATD